MNKPTCIILAAGMHTFKDSKLIKKISNVCDWVTFPTSYSTIIWQDKSRDKIYHPNKNPLLIPEKDHTIMQ